MRNEHQIEKSFKDWLKAGYGGKQIHPIQEQEVKRAFMAGVFEGLNFVINQEGNLNAERDICDLYKFLKAFHENEIAVNKKSPFGKSFY